MIVLAKDAIVFEYTRGMLVVLARPCHGAWIYQVISKAHEAGAEVLYVGKPDNVEMDIDYDGLGRKLLLSDAGEENEEVWSMKPEVGDTIKFCLVRDDFTGSKWWMEDGGDRWINCVGGWRPKGKKKEALEECWAENYEDLDHTKTDLLVPEDKADAGWIDRDGKFYGCDSQHHDSVIRLIIKKEVGEVEELGWVRVHSIRRQEFVAFGHRMSADQRNTASRLGLALREWD